MGNRRKYLIITYFYAPNISARAFRWSALAERWAAQGHHVDVVCGWEPGLAHEETLRGCRVYRVNSMLTEKLRGSLKSADSRGKVQLSGENRPLSYQWLKGKVAAAARWVYHHVYKNLHWPDGGALWRSPALRKALALAENTPYDTLITVSPHFSGHLVGLALHRRFPNLLWLVDIGDPFSFLDVEPPNNRLLYAALNRHTERNVFRHADVISVTTQLTRESYVNIFAESVSKIHVIPPLLSLPEITHVEGESLFPRDNKIRLVFAGILYVNIRPPDFLLRLFAALLQTSLAERLELHFFGDTRQAHTRFQAFGGLLNQKIFLHGMVNREQVAQAMSEANVLVNIGNKTPYQLPSKVVEYAYTGKPILNLAQIKNDSSEDFFKEYPAALCLCDPGDEQNIEGQVAQLFQFIEHLPPPVDPVWLREWLLVFQLDSIASAYERLIFETTSYQEKTDDH